jgi:hypothetical protein
MPIVIDDESDDDLPLFARPRATMPAKREGSSDEEPDWMKSFKSPTAKADDDDSDDGMILDIFQRKPNKTEEKFEMKSTPAKMVRSPPAGATKEANDDDKDADENDEDEAIEIDEEDDDDDDDDGARGEAQAQDPDPQEGRRPIPERLHQTQHMDTRQDARPRVLRRSQSPRRDPAAHARQR